VTLTECDRTFPETIPSFARMEGFTNGDPSIPPPPPDVLAPPPPPGSSAPPPPSELPPPPPSDTLPPPPEEPSKKKKAGWGASRDRGPLSIEDILKKKKEADEAAAKVRYPAQTLSSGCGVHKAHLVCSSTNTNFLTSQPKFLSKAAREKLALEKRAKEVEEQKRKLEAERNGVTPSSNGHAAQNGRDVSERPAQRETNGRGPSSVPTGPRATRELLQNSSPQVAKHL
jgi:ATP-dependent RNA helicase DDX23/PRP28